MSTAARLEPALPVPAPPPRAPPPPEAVPERVARLDRLALGVVAAATVLHVLYAGLLALSPQEAYYWTWSRRLDLSYFDHPPLAAWTVAATTALLGESERAIRAAAALHSAIFCVFLWLSARRLFGSRVALLAVSAGLAVPLLALGQVIVTPDGPLLSGWAMALYFTARTLDDDDPRWLVAAGAATGWALLGKYTGALLVPQIGLALLLDPRGRRMLRTPWPWLGAGVALALFSPVLAWNLARHGASFAFQTEDRVAHALFRPHLVGRFVGLQAALVTPVLLYLLVEGVVEAVRRRAEAPWRLCAIFAAPLLALTAAISPFVWVKGNWVAPAYATALVAAAALAGERRGRRWKIAIAGAALALAASLYVHLVPLVPALPFPARDEGCAGWRQLAARVEAERAAIGPDAFVAGCNYKVSAELGYYLPGRPRTWSGEIAGDHGLQYRQWFDPAELAGRTGVVVMDAREGSACRKLSQACHPIEELFPVEVRRGAETVTTFRLFRCRYAGPPPAP